MQQHVSITAFYSAEARLQLLERLERLAQMIHSENILLLTGRTYEVGISNSMIIIHEKGRIVLRAPRGLAEGILHILPEQQVTSERVIRSHFQQEHLHIILDIAHDTPLTRLILTQHVRREDDPQSIRERMQDFLNLLPARIRQSASRRETIPLHVHGNVNPRIIRMLPTDESHIETPG